MKRVTNKEAIKTLSRELWHTESHMKIEGKESEYYEELSQIAEALRMAIKALKKEEPIWWEVIDPNDSLTPFGITRLTAIVRCPKCKTIRQGMTYYCSWCGSKMMWNGMPLTAEEVEKEAENDKEEKPHGKCKSCRHRDPEDKKCDCGGLERLGCNFPVNDNYYCKYYEEVDDD